MRNIFALFIQYTVLFSSSCVFVVLVFASYFAAIHNPNAFNPEPGLLFFCAMPWIIIYKISFCKHNGILLALHSLYPRAISAIVPDIAKNARTLTQCRVAFSRSVFVVHSFAYPLPGCSLTSPPLLFCFAVDFWFQQHMALTAHVCPISFISSFNIVMATFRSDTFSLHLRFNLFISYLSACNCPLF